MPRRLFQKFRPFTQSLRDRWYFRALGPRLTDPRLWSLNRRAITAAFGTGVAIAFIPLPVHLPVGCWSPMIWRLNMPTMIGTLLLFNPDHRGAAVLRRLSGGRTAAGHTAGPVRISN